MGIGGGGRLSRKSKFVARLRFGAKSPAFGERGLQNLPASRGRVDDENDCAELFVAKSVDGIETRGFYGGIHAEEKADAHGDGDAEHDGPERNGGGQ
jgi:hypothetical protein